MPTVTIDGVEYVPRELGGLKVGDFVRVKRRGAHKGEYGKVIHTDPPSSLPSILVEFATPFIGGYDGGGRTKWRHGRWFYPSDLSAAD